METNAQQLNTLLENQSPSIIARVGAAFLAIVAFMQPLEVVAAQCSMKSPPVCLDSTPCKNVHDPMFPNDPAKTVKVCLSNAAQVGALTTSATCWQYTSTYDCLDPNAISKYNDTCAPIAADTAGCPSYQELNSKCAEPLSSGGLCPSFDVTYQCVSRAGQSYTEQNCNGLSLCVGTACTLGSPEKNTAFAKVAATAEVSRQAGMYAQKANGDGTTDPNAIRVFTGEAGNCSQNTLGFSDCCKASAQGADYKDTIIVQELMKYGWNSWVRHIVGSEYTYDTLFSTASGYVSKAVDGMSRVVSRWMDNAPPLVGPPAPVVTAPTNGTQVTTKSVSTMTSFGYTAGGYLGGAVGTKAGAKIAQMGNANFQATGVITAIASSAGQVGGTMIAGAVMEGVSAAYAGGTYTTVTSAMASGASSGLAVALGPVLIAALVIAIVMALVACNPNEVMLQMKLGAGLCHWVGSYCSLTNPITGNCMTRNQDYCCFNGKLPKIIQEQGRPQINKGWGVPGASTDCSGFTVTELSSLNFAAMDFSDFVKDVYARAIPNQADLANQITQRTQAFFNNNSNPTATNGQLISTPPAVTPAPVLSASDPLPAKPLLGTCAVAMTQGIPAPDGTIIGTFKVTNCNASANLIWTYIGSCPAVPKYTSVNLVPTTDIVTTDATGAATFTRTLPPSCLTQGSPSIYNAWKFMVTDPAAGYLGAINAPWQ